MRITTLPQIYRNVNRLTEILSVLSKYGLADWIDRLHLDFAKNLLKDRDGTALARHTRETRIRLALTELGPTFIKLGQLLSSRPDLVGGHLASELGKLRDDVPPDPPEVVVQTLEEELGQPLDDLFAHFDPQPIATASIGQVHRAQLKSGKVVVVKVQRAGVGELVRKDLEVLGGLARMVERLPEFAPYRPVATVGELQRTLRRELDFGREERNLQQFASRFADNPYVRIPHPISELCTPKALTMEELEGIKLTDQMQLDASGLDREELARRGAQIYLQMIFRDGIYHADPHPGNIILMPNNVIGLLDFGMVGRVEEPLREDFEELLLALVAGDASQLCSILSRIAQVPPTIDQLAFRADISDFVSDYGTRKISGFPLSQALSDMTEIIFRYRLILPPQVAMLMKLLITLDGTLQLLSPNASILDMLQPFRRSLIRQRLSPARRMRKLRRIYQEVENAAEMLPRQLIDLLQRAQTGKFEMHLDHRGLEPSVNRLAMGLLVSSLFLGSALMLSMEVPPVLFPAEAWLGLHRVSMLGISGLILSLLLGLRLLRAIGKSGHLDRRE